jgi:hypothetical protein
MGVLGIFKDKKAGSSILSNRRRKLKRLGEK